MKYFIFFLEISDTDGKSASTDFFYMHTSIKFLIRWTQKYLPLVTLTSYMSKDRFIGDIYISEVKMYFGRYKSLYFI